MHYLECKQLGRSHHAPHHLPSLSSYTSPRPQSASPATPPLAGTSLHHYFPGPVSNSLCYTTGQQPMTPYQMTSPHIGNTVYSNTTPPCPEGVCYTGSVGNPSSPLTTYQMIPPPTGKKTATIQQQSFAQSQFPREAMGNMAATGQVLQKSDPVPYVTHPNDSSPESIGRQLNDCPPPLSVRSPHAQQLQGQSPSPLASKTTPPVAGFGRINCVVCGGTDHVTYNCTQRNKFFTHM